MNLDFLPANYEAPKTSNNYLKLQEGETRIRILSRPIMGWEDWTPEKKPIRFKMNEKPSRSIDGKTPIRHFWSMIVFNVMENKIQILHITQATIRKAIEGLCRDSDWGNPFYYDIKISKTGEGIDTEYTVNPVPHKPVDQSILDMFNNMPCSLDAIFTNEDPFSKQWATFTPLAINNEPITEKVVEMPCISIDEFIKLGEALNAIPSEDRTRIEKQIDKLGVKDMSKLPLSMLPMVMHAIESCKKVSV